MPYLVASFCSLLTLTLTPRLWRRHKLPARTLIVTPARSTTVAGDGTVRSVQSALVTLSQEDLAALWTVQNLENLGRTYWRFLSRAMLGLVRVRYTQQGRSVLALGLLPLLRFAPPEYDQGRQRARISWAIKDGLLVSRKGRGSGHLAIEVQCEDPTANPAKLLVEVEVTNFYPAVARIGFPFYRATQAFVHVRVTHAFLRSLASLRLQQSRVGYFNER